MARARSRGGIKRRTWKTRVRRNVTGKQTLAAYIVDPIKYLPAASGIDGIVRKRPSPDSIREASGITPRSRIAATSHPP